MDLLPSTLPAALAPACSAEPRPLPPLLAVDGGRGGGGRGSTEVIARVASTTGPRSL